jgi:hypothetical protein
MTQTTILLLLLSLLIAGGLSYFQYLYKAKIKSKTYLLLALLRFIAIFAVLLALINPIVKTHSFEIQKTPLPIIVDNSSSVKHLGAHSIATELYQKIISNSELQEKFEIASYQFDAEFNISEEFNFKGKQSNLEKAGKSLQSMYRNKKTATILLTDGNQTTGNDYLYSFDTNTQVYPLVLGDTTTCLDLKINHLNVNRYAFHKNKFPVEVFMTYSGNKSITAKFSISNGNTQLHNQSVKFGPSQKSIRLNLLLPANKIGLQLFKANIFTIEKEKNTYNNTKNFAVEVIDQKLEIALVSSINHPDLGALKRAIESNVQRKVSVVKPEELKTLSSYNVLILYQPNYEFKSILDQNKIAGINTFIITGTKTDFDLLNQQQKDFVFKMTHQTEDFMANFETQFNLFELENIGFENLPPLQNTFGSITATSNVHTLLSSSIRNMKTEMPLLAYSENSGKRSVYLFGENIWKWRLQNHINQKSHEPFDVFMDKTMQYLATNNSKKALVVSHENYYNSGDAIEISAQYFNKNYELDQNAALSISITNAVSKKTKVFDLLKSSNAFKVNLDGLTPGKYQFKIKEAHSNNSYQSFFEVLDFDIEKQFVNPDWDKLNQLAMQTKGTAYLPNEVDALIQKLIKDEGFTPIQKEVTKKTPLIDWIWLMLIILICLSSEWFIRKYNGMV